MQTSDSSIPDGATLIEAYLGAPSHVTRDRILSRIQRYVEIETPSAHPQAIDALAAMIAGELRALGGDVEIRPAPSRGSNLIATFTGAGGAAKPIVMMAHMDTVHDTGTLAVRPFRIEDGRAYGPGVYDMKAGLALLVETIAWHAARGTPRARPIVLLITCDEEIGSHTSRDLIAEYARKAEVVLVPEPCLPDGGVKTSRKGVATYRVETRGRAGHAGGGANAGVSAITELMQQCARILAFADHSKGTTINVGMIGGGTATNVIAADAHAGIDVRLAQAGEYERIDAAMHSLAPVHPETTVTIALAESRPPLIRTPLIVDYYEKARTCAAELGVDLKEGMSGGGSDGSLAAAEGAAVLDGLGPLGDGAHAVHEHIVIDDLPFRLALLCRLVERL